MSFGRDYIVELKTQRSVNMQKRSSFNHSLAWLLISILCYASAGAGTYDYLAIPGLTESFNPSEMRLYIPDEPELIRGIYFYVDPYGSDSRYITANETFRTLAAGKQFALMGAHLSNVDMESGIGNGILRALTSFSQLSGRTELAFANIFFEGYSWGGQFSYHFTKWAPERVVGFVTQKGGYHDTSPAGLAINVPGYMFIGELDLPYRLDNLTSIFEAHRPLGAVWVLALQPGAGHERITDRKLLDAYFRKVVDLRVPLSFPPDQPIHLLPIEERLGWLGNRATHAIGTFDCYDADIDLASWLAGRSIGVKWQEFVSDSTVTDTIPCLSSGAADDERCIDPPVFADSIKSLGCSPNPFTVDTRIRFELSQSDRLVLEVCDAGGRRIRTLDSHTFAAGSHELLWNGCTESGTRLPHGVYLLRLRSLTRDETVVIRLLLLK